MSNYKKIIKKRKRTQLMLIAVLVLFLSAYGFFITRPEIKSYEIIDECSPIGGTVSHPIDDVDSCANACNAYCLSLDEKYHDIKFEQKFEGCNNCTCYCKE